jgi:hypothetical protein
MAVYVIKGGTPTFVGGKLDPGGGEEFTRVQSLEVLLKQTREMTGTQPHALIITLTRDASQGTPADLLAHKTKYGPSGRTQKTVFPLSVMLVDDVRRGTPALVGTLHCQKAVLHRLHVRPGNQELTFHASEWWYFNALSGQKEPEDDSLVPVTVGGFDEAPDQD